MKAPFKRGQHLTYTCPRHSGTCVVKYVKWMGFKRSSLIVVEGPDGKRAIVHINDVKS